MQPEQTSFIPELFYGYQVKFGESFYRIDQVRRSKFDTQLTLVLAKVEP